MLDAMLVTIHPFLLGLGGHIQLERLFIFFLLFLLPRWWMNISSGAFFSIKFHFGCSQRDVQSFLSLSFLRKTPLKKSYKEWMSDHWSVEWVIEMIRKAFCHQFFCCFILLVTFFSDRLSELTVSDERSLSNLVGWVVQLLSRAFSLTALCDFVELAHLNEFVATEASRQRAS